MFSLQGAFKVDVYSPTKGLTHSSDYQSNFITSTGLSYPFIMPFVDTFKFLSVGSGNQINTVNTTSLQTPDRTFTSLSKYVNNACGTLETPTGVQLYRAWSISGLNGPSYSAGIQISELGVSPTSISGASGSLFSRIVPSSPITIPSGDYSIITYKLNIGVQSGINSFANIINTSQVNNTDSPVCRYWDILSGKYSLIHNGIKTIQSNGQSQDPNLMPGLEPSLGTDFCYAYLSTDNQQFTVNGFSGGKISTGLFKPWNPNGAPFGTGVCQYHYSVDTTTANRLIDIRRDNIPVPDSGNFRNEIFTNVFQKNNSITTITPDSYVITGRTRSVTRLFSWPNTQNQFQDSFGNDRRIKSLVLSYYNGSHYPYCDMLFASSGLEQNFSVNTGAYTYNGSSITGDYVFLDPYDNLSLSFRLGWSAPCPSNVSGCPGYP